MGLNVWVLSEIYESEVRDTQVDGSLNVGRGDSCLF